MAAALPVVMALPVLPLQESALAAAPAAPAAAAAPAVQPLHQQPGGREGQQRLLLLRRLLQRVQRSHWAGDSTATATTTLKRSLR